MANFLVNIKGKKEVKLFPPSDVSLLSFPPGSSSSAGYDEWSNTENLHEIKITMKPGDVLYIPPFWLHAVRPLTASIAVNVFFRNLDSQLYDASRKDLYGNIDLAAYTQGRALISRIVKSFDNFPAQAKEFYVKRLSAELLSSLNVKL